MLNLRDRQKRQTSGEIVRAAFELFAEYGFEKVTVEMICRRAGVSRATFFNHFAQKEMLLDYFAETRAAKIAEILAGFGPGKASPGQLAEMLVRFAAENAHIAARSKPLFLQTILRQAAKGSLLRAKAEAMQAVLSVLESRRDPRLVFDTLFSVYIGTMLEWMMQPDTGEEALASAMRSRLELALEGAG